MKILFLSSWFPHPPINGAKIRVNNLIRELARTHEIDLFSFVRSFSVEDAERNTRFLQEYCQSIKIVKALPYINTPWNAFLGLFSSRPISVVKTYSKEMDWLVRDALASKPYDVLIASEVNMPFLVSQLASEMSGVPRVLDAIEFALIKDAYTNAKSPGRRFRNWLTWMKLKVFTKSLLQKVDACTVPSEQEKQNLLEIVPGYSNVHVIPHSMDLSRYSGDYDTPHPNSLVFTGSLTYHANFDAVDYFLREVYPHIKVSVPGVSLQVLGNTGNARLEEWKNDASVTFPGLLYDVRPSLRQSWLSVVPLRVGGGTRLKIIESLAIGTPVVSTSKGAEGLDVTHGKNIMIADTPVEFAKAVISILENPHFRKSLSVEGRKLIQERYSSTVMGKQFNSMLEHIVG